MGTAAHLLTGDPQGDTWQGPWDPQHPATQQGREHATEQNREEP